jgi:hypothetical protein
VRYSLTTTRSYLVNDVLGGVASMCRCAVAGSTKIVDNDLGSLIREQSGIFTPNTTPSTRDSDYSSLAYFVICHDPTLFANSAHFEAEHDDCVKSSAMVQSVGQALR